MIERYTTLGYHKRVMLPVSILLTAAMAIGCAGAAPEGQAPTATPEWFEYYPDHYYHAPGKEVISPNIDPSGKFSADQLAIEFRPAVPEQKIAEILAEKQLEVVAYYPYVGAFLVQVDPAQRDAVLEELRASPDVERAEKSGVVRGLARFPAEDARSIAR